MQFQIFHLNYLSTYPFSFVAFCCVGLQEELFKMGIHQVLFTPLASCLQPRPFLLTLAQQKKQVTFSFKTIWGHKSLCPKVKTSWWNQCPVQEQHIHFNMGGEEKTASQKFFLMVHHSRICQPFPQLPCCACIKVAR